MTRDSGHLYFLPNPRSLGRVYVHRAVLEAFVGPRPDGMISRQLNGNPQDNRVENLARGTHAENTADAHAHGDIPTGEASQSPLTVAQVAEIRSLAGQLPSRQIATCFGVSHTTVLKIIRGERWKGELSHGED